MDKNMYDVAIIGGGVSGCACAWNCAKLGLKTILIEKKSYLGGAITGGLVIPMMKTQDNNINNEFYNELIKIMKRYNAQITYSDKNQGWFNPELMKIALDDMLTNAGAEILLNSEPYNIVCKNYVDKTHNDNIIHSIEIKRNILSYYIESTYNDKNINFLNKNNYKKLFKEINAKIFIDASGDAIISEMLNFKMQLDNNLKQAETLRFIMSNIDTKTFSDWLLDLDSDRNVTSVTNIDDEYYMTTAYTWDEDKNWALRPIFKAAIENGDLKEEDSSYFQIFGVPKAPDSVSFNCPRVNQLLPYEEKLISARQAIFRIANFCIKYFPGFEKAYISRIADELGVRVTNRPLAVYNYTVNDIINQTTFDNVALHSNYPIDIHSSSKNDSTLQATDGYDLPIESLMSADCKNLFNIGKAIGADFKSQAALRIQKSCFSMGEAVAKYIKNNI